MWVMLWSTIDYVDYELAILGYIIYGCSLWEKVISKTSLWIFMVILCYAVLIISGD